MIYKVLSSFGFTSTMVPNASACLFRTFKKYIFGDYNRKIGLMTLFLVSPLCAEEKIISWMSDITIHKDGSLLIQENIKVVAERKEILRGIVREFPTRYNFLLKSCTIDFKVLSVTLNGKLVQYYIKNLFNKKEIYIGHKDIFLPPGIYVYQITYKVNRVFNFLKNHDELLWNLTGNGWQFPIDYAKAAIHLPHGTDLRLVRLEGCEGFCGSKGQGFIFDIKDNVLIFETTRPLKKHEGISFVVELSKGVIDQPILQKRIYQFLNDNFLIIQFLIILFFIIFFYLIYVFRKIGQAFPVFTLSTAMSPSLIGYIYHMRFKDIFLIADIIDLAARNLIFIKKNLDGSFALILQKAEWEDQKNRGVLSRYDINLLNCLFPKMSNCYIFEGHNSIFDKALDICRSHVFLRSKKYVKVSNIFKYIVLVVSIPMAIIAILKAEFSFFLIINFLLLGLIYTTWSFLYKRYTVNGETTKLSIDNFILYMKFIHEKHDQMNANNQNTQDLFNEYKKLDSRCIGYLLALGLEKRSMSFLTKVDPQTYDQLYQFLIYAVAIMERKKREYFKNVFVVFPLRSIKMSKNRSGFGGGGGRGW